MSDVIIKQIELKALGGLPFNREFVVILDAFLGILRREKKGSGIAGFLHQRGDA